MSGNSLASMCMKWWFYTPMSYRCICATTHISLLFYCTFLSTSGRSLWTGWTHLPTSPFTNSGISNRLNSCMGCLKPFSTKQSAHHICAFCRTGFMLSHKSFHPCGVAYHHNCVKVGKPFKTWLPKNKGLTMSAMVIKPTFTCKLCQVRAIVGRELHIDVS
jgi:hypothetical protein